MVNSVDFTKRLEKIFQFYGVSATAFAEQIDFNRSTISHLLSGRNKPSLEFVLKVVKKFPEVDLYWLLNGKGTFPSTSTKTVLEKETILPSKKLSTATKQVLPGLQTKVNSEIERIIIFYKDGSFTEHKNS